MRNKTYTITLNLPNNDVLSAMFPISQGPNSDHDVLMLMNDLCGYFYVVRATPEGKYITTSKKLEKDNAMALVHKMIVDQNTRDCNEVTGNGQWGCD